MNLSEVELDLGKIERRAFIADIKAKDKLFEIMKGRVTYGELQSFGIARLHGVTAEQFAALPTRADRMKWLDDRNRKVFGSATSAPSSSVSQS